MKKEFKTNPAMQFISNAEEEITTTKKKIKALEKDTEEKEKKLQKLKEELEALDPESIITKTTKSERLQLLVRPALKQGIKKAADEKGVSVNDLINTVLSEYLERQGK